MIGRIIILIFFLQTFSCKSQSKVTTMVNEKCDFLDYTNNNDFQNKGFEFSTYLLNNRIGYNSFTILKEIEEVKKIDFTSNLLCEKSLELKLDDGAHGNTFFISQWCFEENSIAKALMYNIKKLEQGDIQSIIPLNWTFIRCDNTVIFISSENYKIESEENLLLTKMFIDLLACEEEDIGYYQN